MSQNKVSVVIPVLNEKGRIEHCLDSFLNQTRMPLEVVVVDGGSTDGTRAVLEEYQDKFKKKESDLKIIEERRRGIILARDRGIREAKGKYVYMVDADTTYLKQNIELIETNLNGEWVGVTGYARADKSIWFLTLINGLYKRQALITSYLFKTVFSLRGYHNAFVRQVYLDSGGMNIAFGSVEDEVGLARLLNRKGRIKYVEAMAAITSSRRAERGLGHFLWFLLHDYWGSYWSTRWGKPVDYQRPKN